MSAAPFPPPIQTTKRCQFSLPGKKYDCRRIGKYVLDGKGYCAPHHSVTWQVKNPEFGQQHDWHLRSNHLTGEQWPYESCRRCGAIKHHEGLPQEPCRGVMPRIELRAN